MLSLPGKLTVADAGAQLATLTQAIDALPAGEAAVLDTSTLTQFDTSTLAVLLALRRHCARAGRPLQVSALPSRLAGLARLYGVAELV